MTDAIVDMDAGKAWLSNSSAFLPRESAFHGAYLTQMPGATFDFESFTGNYRVHKRMVSESASASEGARALCYVRFPRFETAKGWNSSESVYAAVAHQYDRLENQLLKLSNDENAEKVVEEGAARSALTVVDELKKHNLAPPELSWHGGDAVVMLWALGDTTYAITVTDGELGYVVRRNRKAVKMVDSIALGAFRLSDLR